MTRVGLVSDSHGDLASLERAAGQMKNCSHIFHLGDYAQDADRVRWGGRQKVFAVRGNCDWRPDAPLEIVATLDGLRILAVHGHRLDVKYDLLPLTLRAQEAGAQIALFGHTHVPMVSWEQGILLVNPGALMNGRYGILELRENGAAPVLKCLD